VSIVINRLSDRTVGGSVARETVSFLTGGFRDFAGSGIGLIESRPTPHTTDAPVQLVEAGCQFPEAPPLIGGEFDEDFDVCPIPEAHVGPQSSRMADQREPGEDPRLTGFVKDERYLIGVLLQKDGGNWVLALLGLPLVVAAWALQCEADDSDSTRNSADGAGKTRLSARWTWMTGHGIP
jgi:hypothetical protein